MFYVDVNIGLLISTTVTMIGHV